MKVDNLIVHTLLYSLIWIFLSHAMCKFVFQCNFNMWVYHTKCIKRMGGFPNNIMILVVTLGIDVAIKIRLMSHILEDTLTETKKIINL